MISDFLPILRKKNFLLLWSSQLFSQVTLNMINFLFLIRLFETTGSTIATSLLWLTYALPAIFIGPFAATLVDILDKRKLLILTNLLQSGTIFLYTYLQESSLFLLYAVAFIYSFLNQFYVPSEQATLPDVVEIKSLPYANSLFFFTQEGALIVGFGIAGPLSNLIGFKSILFLCSLFLFLAFFSVYFLPKVSPKETFPTNLEKLFDKIFDKVRKGYRLIRGERFIFSPLILLVSIQVALAIIIVNLPLIATEIFKISVNSAGMVLIVPAGIGAALGAILVPKILNKGKRKIDVIRESLILLTLTFFMILFLIPELSLIYKLFVGFVAVSLLGFSFTGVLIPSQTFLQEKTPKNFRGRVFGNFWFLVTIATVFPVILSGTISEIFGIKILLFFLGSAFLLALIYIDRNANEFLRSPISSATRA